MTVQKTQSSRRQELPEEVVDRLAGLDDKVLGLYAGGMSVRDVAAQ